MRSGLNYSIWKKDYEKILPRFTGKNVFMLYSGGKDSSLALDLLLTAQKEYEFHLEAHGGALPVHRYTAEEKDRLGAYWQKQGIAITWHDILETDDLLADAPNPCLPCQDARKKVLNKILSRSVKNWQDLIIVISFSLWDIVSYSIEHILADIYSTDLTKKKRSESKRYKETAQRFYPLVKMKEGYAIFRPLIRYNNQEILNVIAEKNIPVLSTACQFKDYRPKRILQQYYEKMGLHFDYHQVFSFARKALDLPDISAYTSLDKEEYLRELI